MNNKAQITKMLEMGIGQTEIAKQLGISKQLVNYHAKKSKRKVKEVKESKRGFTDTPTDYNTSGSSEAKAKPTQITSRLHKLVLSFKLRTPIGAYEPCQIAMHHNQPYKPIRMKGHIDALLSGFRLKARLYPTSLTIYAPEIELPLNANISELLGQAYDAIEATALDIETRLGIPTKKLSKDTLLATINQKHIALRDHPIAEWLRLHGSKLYIPDPEGGEPLLIIDFSHGDDELETLNVKQGDQIITRVKDFTEAVGLGKFDYLEEQKARAEMLSAILQANAALDTKLAYFAEQLNAHAKLIDEISTYFHQLNIQIPQATPPTQQKAGLFTRFKRWLI